MHSIIELFGVASIWMTKDLDIINEYIIPDDVLPGIFDHLSLATLIKIQTVSKIWRAKIIYSHLELIRNFRTLYQTMKQLEKENNMFYQDTHETVDGVLCRSVSCLGQTIYTILGASWKRNSTFYEENDLNDLQSNVPFTIHLTGPVISQVKKIGEHGYAPFSTTHSIYLTYKILRSYSSFSNLFSGEGQAVLAPDKWKIKTLHPDAKQQELVHRIIESIQELMGNQKKENILFFLKLLRVKPHCASLVELRL